MPRKALVKRRKRRTRYPMYRNPPQGGFPDKMWATFKFVDWYNLVPATGGIASNTFCANGMYDVDITGVGGQPRYFDTLIGTVYDQALVTNSRIAVTQFPYAAEQGVPGIWGIITDDNETLTYLSAHDIIQSQPKDLKYRLGGLNEAFSGGNKPALTHYFSTKKFFGVKDVSDNHNLVCSAIANPASKAYFQLWYGSPDENNAPALAKFMVEITYTALLTRRHNYAVDT